MASIVLHFEGDRLMDVMSINMRTWWKMLRGERHDNEDGDICVLFVYLGLRLGHMSEEVRR